MLRAIYFQDNVQIYKEKIETASFLVITPLKRGFVLSLYPKLQLFRQKIEDFQLCFVFAMWTPCTIVNVAQSRFKRMQTDIALEFPFFIIVQR
jgi:hypothetical protein